MLALLRPPVLVSVVLMMAGCAGRPEPVAMVAPPPVYAAPPPMPAGAHAGMAIPALLADGSYQTPNRALSTAAATWHLRAALNVAALACRGEDETTIVARYNAMLAAQKTTLKEAEATLATEFKAIGGAEWRDRYDDAMTRLYNYFSQSFVREAFCAQASTVLAESATVAPVAFGKFAATRLPTLDRPFTDFYRAYDAWRSGELRQPVIALASSPSQPPAPTMLAPAPRLDVDLSAIR